MEINAAPTLAGRLAQFALAVRYDALPPATIAAARRVLLDTLGCALGAVASEPARIVAACLPRTAEKTATIIGSGARTSAENAALVNGVLARYLDFMDVYSARDVCHPSENVPVALACTEAAGGSGRALLEAVVVGYEAQLRLAHAFGFHAIGMHHVSAAGFVVPLIAGKLWGLRAEQLAHAVSLSGMRHLTLHALAKGRLSMAKAAGYPLSAMEGIFATRLAARGFTAPGEALEWLFAAVPAKADAPRPEALDLDCSRYRIEHVSLKQFPVQFELQTPVEIAVRLHRRLAPRVAGIVRVVIEVLSKTKERTADPAKFRPENRETADHSLPVCVAMALLDGKLEPAQFEAGRWRDSGVLALAARTEVLASPALEARAPDGRPAALTVELDDGTRISDAEDIPLGDAARPMDEPALERKFGALARPVLGARRARRVVAAVRAIEDIADVGELTRLLKRKRGHAGRSGEEDNHAVP